MHGTAPLFLFAFYVIMILVNTNKQKKHMGINTPHAPEVKAPAPKENPSKLAADKQRDLLASVEEENTIGKKDYKAGEMGLSPEQRRNLTPAERAKYPLLEKGKKYIAVGGVDKVPFKQKVQDAHWYYEMAVAAKGLFDNFDAVAFDFPAIKKNPKYKEQMKRAASTIAISSVDLIAGAITPEQYKAKIESGFSAEEIYGAQGAFNVILAFGRAQDLLNNVQPGASIDYRLKLSGKKYSQLLAKKEKAEGKKADAKPEVKPDAKPEDPQAKNERLDWEAYNTEMQEFFKRISLMRLEIKEAEKNGSISKVEADGLRLRLSALDVDTLPEGQKPHPQARQKYEDYDKATKRIRKDFEDMKKKNADAAALAQKPVNLPDAPTVEGLNSDYDAGRILNLSSELKNNYEWTEGKSLDYIASVIAKDVVEVIKPSAGKDVRDSLIAYAKTIVLSKLDAQRKGSPENANRKSFAFDKAAQIAVVSPVLAYMKQMNIKSNALMGLKK